MMILAYSFMHGRFFIHETAHDLLDIIITITYSLHSIRTYLYISLIYDSSSSLLHFFSSKNTKKHSCCCVSEYCYIDKKFITWLVILLLLQKKKTHFHFYISFLQLILGKINSLGFSLILSNISPHHFVHI